MRRGLLLEHFPHDLRFGFRSLGKNPMFSAAAILTFALGIGANTAIFSVVNAVLLRPLPYPQSGQIVELNLAWKDGTLNSAMSVPEFEFYREHNRIFQAMAGFRAGSTVSIRMGDVPEWVKLAKVTDGFFRVLGVPPAIGRDIERSETRPGGARVAVISHALWQNAFGADPAIIGRQIEINDS